MRHWHGRESCSQPTSEVNDTQSYAARHRAMDDAQLVARAPVAAFLGHEVILVPYRRNAQASHSNTSPITSHCETIATFTHASLIEINRPLDRAFEMEHIVNIWAKSSEICGCTFSYSQEDMMVHLLVSAAFLALGMVALSSIIRDLTRPIAI